MDAEKNIYLLCDEKTIVDIEQQRHEACANTYLQLRGITVSLDNLATDTSSDYALHAAIISSIPEQDREGMDIEMAVDIYRARLVGILNRSAIHTHQCLKELLKDLESKQNMTGFVTSLPQSLGEVLLTNVKVSEESLFYAFHARVYGSDVRGYSAVDACTYQLFDMREAILQQSHCLKVEMERIIEQDEGHDFMATLQKILEFGKAHHLSEAAAVQLLMQTPELYDNLVVISANPAYLQAAQLNDFGLSRKTVAVGVGRKDQFDHRASLVVDSLEELHKRIKDTPGLLQELRRVSSEFAKDYATLAVDEFLYDQNTRLPIALRLNAKGADYARFGMEIALGQRIPPISKGQTLFEKYMKDKDAISFYTALGFGRENVIMFSPAGSSPS